MEIERKRKLFGMCSLQGFCSCGICKYATSDDFFIRSALDELSDEEKDNMNFHLWIDSNK